MAGLGPLPANARGPTYLSDSEFLIDSWGTEDGLPENSATAMVQTPDGFLWIGTYDGLVRFDGLKVTVLNRANTPALPASGIANLYFDRSRRLWVSTLAGLVVHDGAEWRSFGAEDGWVGNYVRTFAERPDGDLLMTTFDGHVLTFRNGRFTELPSPPGDPRGYFGAVDEAGHWWVTQNRFVGWWNGQAWISALEPSASLGSPSVTSFSAQGGGLWILLGKELRKFQNGQEVSRQSIPNLRGGIWSAYEDRANNIWIATFNEGLFRLDSRGGWKHWATTNGLGHLSCRFVFEDREENIWVGTSGRGLRRFKPRRFVDLSPPELTRGSGKSVAPARDGGMWIAAYGAGLFRHAPSGLSQVPVPGPQGESIYGLAVLEDRSGRLWYADAHDIWWRRGEASFEKIPLPSSPSTTIAALFEDSRERVWMASGAGAVVCEGNAFQYIGPAEGLPSGSVNGFAEDRAGEIWIATAKGVVRYQEDRAVPVPSDDGASLGDVLCLQPESDGTMWIGTRDRGLWRWREKSTAPVSLSADLSDLAVHAIIADDLGYFWITTNRGIVRVARQELHAAADGSKPHPDAAFLDRHDGLPGIESPVGQPTCARDANGQLWFSLHNGLARIDPATFRRNPFPPPITFEGLTYRVAGTDESPTRPGSGRPADERVVHLRPPFPEPLKLPPGSHGIEIEFTAPSFSAPEKIQFQTRLEGSRAPWEKVDDRRGVRIFQLPPGDYNLRVRAANNDGVWSELGSSLAFTVRPFFWQTIWFWIGSVLGTMTSIGTLVWWKLRRRRQFELEKLERDRTQHAELTHLSRVNLLGELSGSLAHELNQPLGAILANAEAAELLLQRPTPDLAEIREILADIHKDDLRAGEIIHGMRALLRRRELEKEPLDLTTLIRESVNLIRADAAARNTTVVWKIPPNLPRVIGDRVHLQQVLLNLILNGMDAMQTLKPADRHLMIQARHLDPETVQIAIRDTGVGLPPEDLERVFDSFRTSKPDGLGMGLAISRSIVEAHGGSISIQNNPDQGATVKFALPAESTNLPE